MILTTKLKLPRPEESDNHNLVNQQALIDAIEANALARSEMNYVKNYALATQAEAEAGTSNAKYMTPLTTQQAIKKLAPKPTAETVTIMDAGNYYDGTNTEAALQEIGQALNGSRGSIIAATNQLFLL